MNLIEQIIIDKIKRYGVYKLAVVIVLSILLLSKFKSPLGKFLNLKDQFSFDSSSIFYGIFLFITLTILIIFILFLLEFLSQFWFRVRLIFRNKINFIPEVDKWLFQGSLKIEKDLEITSSNSGCILKNFFYKDFIMSFRLRIENGGRAGIIFRAQDLENYFMIQIEQRDYITDSVKINGIEEHILKESFYPDHIAIVPHVRFLGNFETFNIDKREPFFPTNLILHGFKKCHPTKDIEIVDKNHEFLIWLKVKKNQAILKIDSEEFVWDLPTHVEPNIIQKPDNKISPIDDIFVRKIWFRNRYGRIGFRAYGLERAVIRDLSIEKI